MGTPIYPQASFERRDSGRVAVELDFHKPDTQPRIKVLASEGGDAFETAVREFVRAYRVPCLEPGQTVQLRQEFVFKPTDGRRVSHSEPLDADEQRRLRLYSCVAHLRPNERIEYPSRAREREEHGTVVLKLEFTDPSAAPQISVIDNAKSVSLSYAAREHAQGMRMPCHTGASVDFIQLYDFRFEGGARVLLTDVSFAGFLRSVKGIQQANVYFDFHAMGCPFEIRLKLYRPHGANVVGELGAPNPERRFFIDWLRRQELNLDRQTLNAVLGQQLTLTVPCTVLNLGATSGGTPSQ